jgi:hypothetical protein
MLALVSFFNVTVAVTDPRDAGFQQYRDEWCSCCRGSWGVVEHLGLVAARRGR